MRRVDGVVTSALRDPERAHGEEDQLYADLLRFIADECKSLDEARKLAQVALSTGNVDFPRCCA